MTSLKLVDWRERDPRIRGSHGRDEVVVSVNKMERLSSWRVIAAISMYNHNISGERLTFYMHQFTTKRPLISLISSLPEY